MDRKLYRDRFRTGVTRACLALSIVLTLAVAPPVELPSALGEPVNPNPHYVGYQRPALFGMGKDLDHTVTMSDGVNIMADVFYPTDPATSARAHGPFPVLLQQTPYGKNFVQVSGNITDINTGLLGPIGNVLQPLIGDLIGSIAVTDVPNLVQHGYIVVLADVRGTGESGGTWSPLQDKETTDGVTMVDWASKLPDSNGKVGLFGLSLMGMNAYKIMQGLPKNSPVKAAFITASANEFYPDLVTNGGMPKALFDYEIALTATPTLALLMPIIGPIVTALINNDADAARRIVANTIPLELQHARTLAEFVLPTVVGGNSGGDQQFNSDFWRTRDLANALPNVVANDIPVFEVGDWRDLFPQGTLKNFVGLQNLEAGRPQTAPMLPDQHVTPRYQALIGPWTHLTNDVRVVVPLQLEWFDTWLLGMDTPLAHQQNVLHLVQQRSGGQWFDAKTWPLLGDQATQFFLTPAPTNTRPVNPGGMPDASLATTPPTNPAGDTVLPWLPISSPCNDTTDQNLAGTETTVKNLFHGLILVPCVGTGDLDNSTFNWTGVTYTSPPFPEDMAVAGPVTASINMALAGMPLTNPSEAELVANLDAVSTDGSRSVFLSQGTLLGSDRALDERRTWRAANGEPIYPHHPYTRDTAVDVPAGKNGAPGPIIRYDIAVGPTLARIPAGWRLRLTLTTADTPSWFPPLDQAPKLIGGIYHIQNNATTPSFVNIPLVPAREINTPCEICQGWPTTQ
ncbi:CocE/NonD family hydrolase [Nocardia terpenica]|uniref:Xaa-Pro dipeptidyl-peptidase C-terminal domain-containing protein n=1 Tax=Nocardia terpenica TaxID=455432 RepID=A0A291RPL1_9NOCA|nr:CocE/NonD family hydrolase [Nocardia terpenica]ATL69240.1 hypothetical protein CRH09_26770 [Nocardia terpenica]